MSPWSSSRVVLASLGLIAAVGCRQDQGWTQLKRHDSFQQVRMNAVDLLVVIDNSCSMVEEQDNLARNFDSLIGIFEEAEVDWRIAVTTTDVEVRRYRGLLMGGDDEIILRGPSGELERVEYDRTWGATRGTSLALSADMHRAAFNDLPSSWCASTASFGSGSFGTPGAWNPRCDGQAHEAPSPQPDSGPRAPVVNDLVISEIMSMPAGQDSLCEWFEIANTSHDTLALDGIDVLDAGRNMASFPEGTTIGPRGLLVVGRSTDRAANCDTPVDVAFAEGLSLHDDLRVIDRTMPDGRELFSEQVAQGTIGTGIEMGLEAARLVFEEPYYTEHNEAWLREEASLSILVVSDEEDASPWPVNDYIRYYTDLKGDAAYRDRSMVNFSAVIGKDRPPREDVPACESDSGVAWYGRRYLEAVQVTDGLSESICSADFAPIVSRLGLTLSGLEAEFGLSDYPRLETLVVKLYDDEADEAPRDEVEAHLVRVLERDVDFTYVFERNVLRFEAEQVPPSEYIVTAEYDLLPAGQRPGEGEQP